MWMVSFPCCLGTLVDDTPKIHVEGYAGVQLTWEMYSEVLRRVQYGWTPFDLSVNQHCEY